MTCLVKCLCVCMCVCVCVCELGGDKPFFASLEWFDNL